MSSLLQVKYKMLLDALNKRAAEGEVIEFKESVSTLFQKYLKILDIQTKLETYAPERLKAICFSE